MAWLGGDGPPEDPTAALEAANGQRQWQQLCELVDEAITRDDFAVTPAIVCELNRLAVDGLIDGAGLYREDASTIHGSVHCPPPAVDVPVLVERMLVDVASVAPGATPARRAMHRAAFVLWRLNWIHPFRDGNGRTARAVAHLTLCRELRQDLPGSPTWVARMLDEKNRYYRCLEQADLGWRRRKVADVTNLAQFLERLVRAQLASAGVEGA